MKREVDFAWTPQGRLNTISAPLSGAIPVFRIPGVGGPQPPGASTNSTPGTTKLLRTFGYDYSTGNVTSVLEPSGRCTVTTYDAAYGQLPIMTSVNTSGGCGSSGTVLATTRMFERGFEQVTTEYSAADEETVRQYDEFGRLVEVDQQSATIPGTTSPSPVLLLDYPTPSQGITIVHAQAITGANPETYADSWTYSDGFGRTLASITPNDAGNGFIVNGLTTRTANGHIANAYTPQKYSGPGDQYPITTAPTGASASFTYDALGQTLTATGIDHNTMTYRHNRLALSVDIIDPERPDSFTTNVSDGHGRLATSTKTIAADPSREFITTSYQYAPTGEVLSRTKTHAGGPSDAVTHSFLYDSLGRMVQSLEPNSTSVIGEGWTYAYNDNGDLVGTSDARGCGKNLAYDAIGRLQYEDYSPCQSDQYPYTPVNLGVGLTGLEALYLYDEKVGPGEPPVGSYLGKLTAAYDRAQASFFEYDPRGRKIGIRRYLAVPGSGSAGNYAPHLFQQSISYDDANRPSTMTSGADDPALQDDAGSSSETFTYTLRGNVASVKSSYGDLLEDQGFDEFNSVTAQSLGDAAHTQVTRTYDAGRLASFEISRWGGPWLLGSPGLYTPPYYRPAPGSQNTMQEVLTDVTFGYSPAGTLTSISDKSSSSYEWPLGTAPATKVLAYDDAYRLKSVTTDYSTSSHDDPFLSPVLSVDVPLVPRVAAGASGNRIRSESFTYDWLDNPRVADDNEHVPDRSPGTLTYADPSGPNRVNGATQGKTHWAPTYDDAGNITSIAVTKPCAAKTCTELYSYVWDEVGHLQTATHARAGIARLDEPPWVTTLTFDAAYDANGERVYKSATVTEASTYYTVNVFPTLRLDGAMFEDGNFQNDTTTERVLFPVADGVRVRVQIVENDAPSQSSGVRRVFLEIGDQLGSSSFVIDKQSSELVERATYETYGRTEADYRPDRWNNFRETDRYTGKADDAEVGLVYFGARYYSSTLGRWMSPDPLAVHTTGGDMNAYGFVRGSPMGLVDPDGLDGCDNLSPGCNGGGLGGIFGAIGGFVGGVIGSIIGSSGGSGGGGGYHGTGVAPSLPPPAPTPVSVSTVDATDEEAFAMVPIAAQNWAVDGLANLANAASHGAIFPGVPGIPVSIFPHVSLDGLRAPAPPENGTTQREQTLRKSYDAARGALTAISVSLGILTGGAALVGESGARIAAEGAGQAIITEGKFGYLFGEASGNAHNVERALENASQLSRVGVYNNAEGQALLQAHFDAVVGNSSNIIRSTSNQYGNFVTRESLFAGPGGSVKFESTWQVLEGGGQRFITAIPLGGP